MKLVWYGDDFTGATDTLAVAALAGLRCMLFLDVPTPARLGQAGPLDALGIAGSARTLTPPRMREELARVGRFFQTLGAQVLHYKCCSTFDSSASVGSIGTAVEALRPFVATGVPYVVGGQPNIGRYCCFSNLYAAAGAGAEVFRLDRHPTMSAHPVTPMHEADLRRVLSDQGLSSVAGIHYPGYSLLDGQLDAQVDHLVERLGGDPSGALLFDVAEASHLEAVGRQIWRRASNEALLAVGSSAVVQALSACWNADAGAGGAAGAGKRLLRDRARPVFVLAGSMSPVTARQVEGASSFQRQALDARRLVADGSSYMQEQVDIASSALVAGRDVLAYVSQTDRGPDDAVSASDLAHRTADLLNHVLCAVSPRISLQRVGVAGGDTSSLAVQSLDIWALSFVRVLSPGVSLCRAHSDDPALDGLELMLKGGQMGAVDIFERLLAD